MSGWIYGSAKDKQWTQVFSRHKKFKFQNPLHQDFRHTQALSEKLDIPPAHVHSVVIFVGAEVKTLDDLPPNVVVSPLLAARYIKTFDEIVFSDEELWHIENALYGLQAGQVSESEHIYNLRNRYAQTDRCPKCGSAMVERVAKRGANKGEIFMACSAYPKCKYVVK